MNKNILKALLFSLCLSSITPIEVSAEEKNYFEFTNEDLKKIADALGNSKIVRFSEKVNEMIQEKAMEPIIEKIKDINYFKPDSLWLVTDIPNENPNEKRNYYFVYNKICFYKTTTFFDKENNEVDKNNKNAVRKREKALYLSASNPEKTFVMETNYDLVNRTFTTNFVDFNEDYVWEEENQVQYGRFVDILPYIPEELQQDKYDATLLQEIEYILNDCDYKELFGTSRERKVD